MTSGHSGAVPRCPGRRWKLLPAASTSRKRSCLDGKKKRFPKSPDPLSTHSKGGYPGQTGQRKFCKRWKKVAGSTRSDVKPSQQSYRWDQERLRNSQGDTKLTWRRSQLPSATRVSSCSRRVLLALPGCLCHSSLTWLALVLTNRSRN